MQLEEFYEFLESRPIDGIVITQARDLKSHKLVQIHCFPAQLAKEAKDLLDLLPNLPIPELAKIIKFGKDGNWSYLITEPLPEAQNVREWIRQAARTDPPRILQPSTPLQPAGPTSLRLPESVTGAPQVPSQPRAGQPRTLLSGDSLPGKKQKPETFTQIYNQGDSSKAAQGGWQLPAESISSPSVGEGSFTRIYNKSDWNPLKPILDDPSPSPPVVTPAGQRHKAEQGLETFIGLKRDAPAAEPVAPPIESDIPSPLTSRTKPEPPIWNPDLPSSVPWSPQLSESLTSSDYSSRELERGTAVYGPHIVVPALEQTAASMEGKPTTGGSIIDWKIVLLSTVIFLTIFLAVIALVERST